VQKYVGLRPLGAFPLWTETSLVSETKRPNGSRFCDALVVINPGACNPSGVALSIADACREIREHENADTKKICQDPAIRLMVFQLAHLFGVAGAQYDVIHYINYGRTLRSPRNSLTTNNRPRPLRSS
jgi:hypothetical protein